MNHIFMSCFLEHLTHIELNNRLQQYGFNMSNLMSNIKNINLPYIQVDIDRSIVEPNMVEYLLFIFNDNNYIYYFNQYGDQILISIKKIEKFKMEMFTQLINNLCGNDPQRNSYISLYKKSKSLIKVL